MIIVRFLVGEDEERALVRLHQKLGATPGLLPPGASPPVVQSRSIDDVPVMALTLWGEGYDDAQLRQLGGQLQESLKETAGHLRSDGHRRPSAAGDRRARSVGARGARPRSARGAAGARGRQRPHPGLGASSPTTRRRGSRAAGGSQSADAIRSLVVSSAGDTPVRLGDVATVVDGGGEPTDYVQHHPRRGQAFPAVTLSIAKRKGVNAIELTRDDRAQGGGRARLPPPARPERLDHARLRRDRGAQVERAPVAHVPRRGLGRRAHLAGARPARVARRAGRHSGHARADAVRVLPLRLHAEPHHALRPHLLDRHPGRRCDRRRREHRAARADDTEGASLEAVAIRAVDEVGNPTILATLAVVAAILPMAFVGGPDGALHAADSGRRLRGDALLAHRGVHRHAVGRRPPAAAARTTTWTRPKTG